MDKVTTTGTAPLPFIDLRAQRERLGGRIEDAVQRVIEHGQYVLGPEVRELEERLAERGGVGHCIACSNGTDALVLALMAYGIGRGDAVVVPAFTFVASAEAVVLVGATPVFADVDPTTLNIDPASIRAALERARRDGLRPAAVMAVDLFGQPADYDALAVIAADAGIPVIADAAQSFGARLGERPVGNLAPVTATSFYPAKPLGCYGDGGAVLTDDGDLAAVMRSIALHGAGSDRYCHDRIGINGRLDTIQAAILLEKLSIFDEEIDRRNAIADAYDRALRGVVSVPIVGAGVRSVWAQYTIRVDDRDGLAARLRERGIPTAIHYPTPLHRQVPYAGFPRAAESLATAERLATEVLSLPFHPYLSESDRDRVTSAVIEEAGGDEAPRALQA